MKKYNFRIKEARERKGLTQAELAAKLGVAQNTFCGYENGNHDPKSNKLAIIAKECDTTVDYLVGKTEDPNSYDRIEKPPTPEGAEDEKNIQMIVSGLTDLLVKAGWVSDGGDLTDAQLRTLASYVIGLNAYFNGQG